MTRNRENQPFHQGEIEVQTKLGIHQSVMTYAPRFIRDHLPEQHRLFYAELPMVLVGSLDGDGRPWASAVFGRPGFIQSPHQHVLQIKSKPVHGDPLNESLGEGAPLGFLGLEFQSRRRNRLNGKVTRRDESGFEIMVDQAFGNCPQYIQARAFEVLPSVDRLGEPRVGHRSNSLNERARAMISAAESFFIATHYSENPKDATQGTDVSHRGGMAGFVKMSGATLTYPEFAGNNHFNTLGNMLKNPRAGLLFPDFKNGDLLYLTCKAEIIWDSPEARDFQGAERLVRFQIEEMRLIEDAMPLRWQFLEVSPSFAVLGSWPEVAQKQSARKKAKAERQYRVSRVIPESRGITSFYLEPDDGMPLPGHVAGQFLPVKIHPRDSAENLTRTYTISCAPNDNHLRLTIKHQTGRLPDVPAGRVSSEFHEHIVQGSIIRALPPAGKFTLKPGGSGPIVLLSAGVGITPMISMLEQLASQRGAHQREVWFIHGTRNSSAHAFAEHVTELAHQLPGLNIHYRYSQPRPKDQVGVHYHDSGHVDLALLQSMLPLKECEFYMCGPERFMRDLYEGLGAQNVDEQRIHYEFFGKGSISRAKTPKNQESKVPTQVRFAKSNKEVTWDATKGSLLELAESAGLKPEFSCRSGICKTCTTTILSGSVAYDDPPQGIENPSQVLICCAYPRGGESLVLDV